MEKLTTNDVLDIESIFAKEYLDGAPPTGGIPALWFKVIMRFLAYKGYKVVKIESTK